MLKTTGLIITVLPFFGAVVAQAASSHRGVSGYADIKTVSDIEACYYRNGWGGRGYYKCGFQRKSGEGFLGIGYDSLTSRFYGSRFDQSPVVGWDHEAGGGR